MKKTRIYITTLLLILTIFVSPVQAATLIDDFNDGNADGWWFGPSHANPNVYGNWRVENGVLVQDVGGDGMIALLENYYISDQTTETQIKYNDPAGYGGILIWFQDYSNFVSVSMYPAAGIIGVDECIDGVSLGTQYPYTLYYGVWYNLKVTVDSSSGNVDLYLNGGYITTHHLMTSTRVGKSGLMNGNGGGYFDDFKIDSNDLPPDAPTGVSATDGNYNDRVRVSWNASSGAAYYEVWRNTSNSTNDAIKLTTSQPSKPYEDTSANLRINALSLWQKKGVARPYDDGSANPGITYYYWVKACSSTGSCSSFSSSDEGYLSQNLFLPVIYNHKTK